MALPFQNHWLARFWSIAAGWSCCGMRPCPASTPMHACKNCVCASKECDIVRICHKINDFYAMSILLVEVQAA